jgi:glycerate dehydrogenase
MPAKIVVLDGYTLNPGDLSWDQLHELGETVIHDRTPAEEIVSRSTSAQVLLTNKTPLRAGTLSQLPDLRFVGVLATGYDVVDIKAASERGIPVSNVPTYGTNSVAQFAFALLLELCHHTAAHAHDASNGGWIRRAEWSYHFHPLVELAGKTMGLIGYGRIGRQTGLIARAFSMEVIAADPMLRPEDGVESVSIDELLRRADVVSLHCPLTPETRGLMNEERLSLMKPSAFLINTSRGPLIDEHALAAALNEGRLAGAGVDVLPVEPPAEPSPLMQAKNCLVTPHIAWATKEARARLMQTAVDNVKAFLAGAPANVVNRG